MRLHASFAAAVAAAAAVVFSVALPTANATPVVIDSFTTVSTPNPVSGSGTAFNNGGGDNTTLSLLPFNNRKQDIQADQNPGTPPAPTFSVSQLVDSSSGGSMTITMTKTASGTSDYMESFGQLQWSNTDTSPVNFTAGGNDSIRITKSAGSYTDTTGGLSTFLSVTSGAGSAYAQYELTPAQVFSGSTLEIPYASFTTTLGTLDWTGVESFTIFLAFTNNSGTANLAGSYNANVVLTEIALVPEPTQMVGVAGVGAALGLWRMRTLRRKQTAGDDATTC